VRFGITPVSLLLGALVVGLGSSGLALVLRAILPHSWLTHRPLGCNLCMSFWGALVVSLVVYPDISGTLIIPIAVPVGVAILDHLWRPAPGFPTEPSATSPANTGEVDNPGKDR